MVQRKVPDGEALELRVPGETPLAVFVVDLVEARRELARARPRSRDDDNRTLDGDERVLAVALVRYDSVDVGWIAEGLAVEIALDAARLELLAELLGRDLPFVARHHDAAHRKPKRREVVDEL